MALLFPAIRSFAMAWIFMLIPQSDLVVAAAGNCGHQKSVMTNFYALKRSSKMIIGLELHV